MSSELPEAQRKDYFLHMAERAFDLSQSDKLYPAWYAREMWFYLFL